MDHQPEPGDHIDPRALHLWNEGHFLCRQATEGVADDVLDCRDGVLDRENVENHAADIRRAHGNDLGIASDDDRVGMVARMAPAPDRRLAHDHETRYLVNRVVHPPSLECGPMSAFMPA